MEKRCTYKFKKNKRTIIKENKIKIKELAVRKLNFLSFCDFLERQILVINNYINGRFKLMTFLSFHYKPPN